MNKYPVRDMPNGSNHVRIFRLSVKNIATERNLFRFKFSKRCTVHMGMWVAAESLTRGGGGQLYLNYIETHVLGPRYLGHSIMNSCILPWGVPTPPKSGVVYLEDILPWGVPTPPKSGVVYLEDILPWGVPTPPKSVVVYLEDILP